MKKTSMRAFFGALTLFFGICAGAGTAPAAENPAGQEGVSWLAAAVEPGEETAENESDASQGTEDSKEEPAHFAVRAEGADPNEKTVALTWDFSSSAAEYAVLCRDEEDWTEVSRTAETAAAVSVKKFGVLSVYKICAYDTAGNLLGESAEFSLLIPKKTGGLRATSQSKTKVRLCWDKSDGASAYGVYVKKGEKKYSLADTVKKPQIKLTVKENEEYQFRVVPIFDSGIGVIEGTYGQIEFVNREVVLLDHQKYSYQEMSADIKALCRKYSDYVTYESVGQSEQGREIYDVILGNPEAINTILVVSTLHGREYIATAVCMKQLEYYLQNYNRTVDGQKLSDVFDRCNVHYIMMANPDGVTISQKTDAKWKGNANGVNLNRNFPYKFRRAGKVKDNSYSGAKAASESETKAVIALTKKLDETRYLAVVNYHAMGNIVFGDYSGKNTSLKNDIRQMYQIARKTTGYRDARSYGGSSNGNYREYLIYNLQIPSITLEMGSAPCPVPQYQYASAFSKNKLVVLREAVWLAEQEE